MTRCVFCAIVAGDEPASVVAEGERAVAFLNIHAFNEGHTLVAPRTHAAGLADLSAADGVAVWSLAHDVAHALRSSTGCAGVNLWLNDGAVAGQDVAHVHLHVVPRHAGDGFEYRFPERHRAERPRADLDRTAARVREALPHS